MSTEQSRALHAMHRLDEVSGIGDDSFRKHYAAYIDRVGPAIVMNGLGQALATECAAAGVRPGSLEERAHQEVFKSIQSWLCRDGGVYAGSTDVLRTILEGDQDHYIRAQYEALAWLVWHKKFCRARFPRPVEAS